MTARGRGNEAGFSLVEVLVAMVLALIVIVAILTTLDKSTSTSLAQQRDTQAVSVGEQEIEQAQSLVKRYGFPSLALSAAPAASTPSGTNPVDPNVFVSGSNYKVLESWHDTSSTSLATEPLLISAGTAGGADRLAPGPETIVSGATTTTVNRYVTRRVDPSCPSGNALCADDSRRVIIAVRISADGADLARVTPIYFSTVINPRVPSNDGQGSGGLAIGVNLP